MTNVNQPTEQWGVAELMGHRQVAGRISAVAKFGTELLQVEIPQPDGTFAIQQFGGSAIYCIHYTSEAKAREIAPRSPVITDQALPAPDADLSRDFTAEETRRSDDLGEEDIPYE